MNYRSTNEKGIVHFGGSIVAGVEDGSGIELQSASSGANAIIKPVGDESNKGLGLLGKGTSGVFVGSTASGSLGFKGAFTVNSTWSNAAINASRSAEITLASTTVDLNPGDLVGAIEFHSLTANGSSNVFLSGYRTSSEATSRVTLVVRNGESTITSTLSGTYRITWIDLT